MRHTVDAPYRIAHTIAPIAIFSIDNHNSNDNDPFSSFDRGTDERNACMNKFVELDLPTTR